MSFELALEALEAYEPAELYVGSFERRSNGHVCRCALGAMVPALRGESGGVFDAIERAPMLGNALFDVGLTADDAHLIEGENDKFGGTPAERFAHVVAWLRERVVAERCAR